MRSTTRRLASLVFSCCALSLLFVSAARGQIVDLTVHDVGLAIGDKPSMTGLRINFRDRNLERITGLNATIWSPYEPAGGVVTGLALGLPVTGAGQVHGLLLAPFGGGVSEDLRGIAVGGLGVGAGGSMHGIVLGGLGAGAGGSITGLAVGGLGAGSGGSVSRIANGGLGGGAGRRVDRAGLPGAWVAA